MKAHKSYYSLIQYCPDRGCAEVANVGVLVFCPSPHFIKARMSTNNDRAAHVFGKKNIDTWWLKAAKKSFEMAVQNDSKRFSTKEDLEAFIASRGNDLVLTQPRSMRSEDPASDLDALFMDYVDSSPSNLNAIRSPAAKSLDDVFLRLRRSRSSIQIAHTFESKDFPLKVRTDYAYENGQANLVKLLPIGRTPATDIEYAVRLGGQSIYVEKHLEINQKRAHLIVVADPTPGSETGATDQQLAEIFDDFPADLIKSGEVSAFIKMVEEEAH